MRFSKQFVRFAFMLAGLSVSAAYAGGPTGWGGGSCREVSGFPAILSEPGVYCLNFKYIAFPLASGALITITADNVVFDLNGATLDGTPKGSAFSFGILSSGHSNITIRNGTVKGFNYGLRLAAPLGSITKQRPSHNILVENLRLLDNRTAGMNIIANDSVIRHNIIAHTGGSPDPVVTGNAWGMIVSGTGVRILDNDVSDTVANTAHAGGVTNGILLGGVWKAMVVGNRINEADIGINSGGLNWGKYRDNITVDVTTPYVGGTDIGNNN